MAKEPIRVLVTGAAGNTINLSHASDHDLVMLGSNKNMFFSLGRREVILFHCLSVLSCLYCICLEEVFDCLAHQDKFSFNLCFGFVVFTFHICCHVLIVSFGGNLAFLLCL
jgi:hypothetical protein